VIVQDQGRSSSVILMHLSVMCTGSIVSSRDWHDLAPLIPQFTFALLCNVCRCLLLRSCKALTYARQLLTRALS